MAIDAADIGANFSNYVGNSGAAGGAFGVVEINTRPLEQLAAYTFYSNRSKWEQKQREADLKVKELADLSDIALNNLRGKDREQATKEFAQLIKDGTDYIRKIPKNQQERMENELKWQTQRGAFMNNYSSGKARAISYEAKKAAINTTVSDAKTKEAQLKKLDEVFDKTDIATPISAVPNFQLKKFDIPKHTEQKFNSFIIGDNQNVSIDGAIYNPKLNAGVADATIIGIKKASPKKGTPEYNALTEAERDQADVQATIEGTASGWVDAIEPLNEALKRYTDDKGVFDATSFENDNASNTTLMNPYNALKRYDSYNREKYTQAKSEMFADKGFKIKLPDNVKADDFKVGFVDFAKGVNPNQLVQSGMFAEYTGDTFTKKLTETGNAFQEKQLAETIRSNKANQYLRGKELKLQEDKWKSASTGSTTQVNGAMERAKRIYGDMVKLADQWGVISPDKLRQLNVEQLKYLGIEAPKEVDDAGTVISAGGFKPLSLTEKDATGKEVPYAIQLINGEIKVLKNAKKLADGTYEGFYDNTKSTTLPNVATNILNEELVKAGSKELNSYMGIDVLGGVTSTTEGGGTTVSGSAKTTDLNSLDPNGFKKEGKNYRYKDGTLYDAKGNIVK